MAGLMKKNAEDHIPFCKDQGIVNLCGTNGAGITMQSLTWTMVAGGVVDFGTEGLTDMHSAVYQVLIQNQSDVADEATVVKTTGNITIAGPDNGDVLDIVIIGRLAGQLA